MTNDDHTRPGDTVDHDKTGRDKIGRDKIERDKIGRDKTTIYNYNYYGTAGTPPPTDPPPPLIVPDRWLLAHPYADLPDFTGRATELADLDAWLAAEAPAVLVVRALGGFGSAVTYDTLHALAEQTATAVTLDADLRDLRARGLLQQHKEADARLVLARLAQQAGNAEAARQQAEAVRRLATCDGPPAHTYYAAYVEAEGLVEAG
jgi:hypothetical protein